MMERIEELENILQIDRYNTDRLLLPEELRFFNNPSISDSEKYAKFNEVESYAQNLIGYYYLRGYGDFEEYSRIMKLTYIPSVNIDKSPIKDPLGIKILEDASVLLDGYLVGISIENKQELYRILNSANIVANESAIEHFGMMMKIGISMYQKDIDYRNKIDRSKTSKAVEQLEILAEITNDTELHKKLETIKRYTMTDKQLSTIYEEKIYGHIITLVKILSTSVINKPKKKGILSLFPKTTLNKKDVKALTKKIVKNIQV